MFSKNGDSSKSKNNFDRCFPLVCDFNPGLPPVGNTLHKNKFILDFDPALSNVIKPAKVFVSYRGNRNIKETLVPSKLSNDCKKVNSILNNSSDSLAINPVVEPNRDSEDGCYHCQSGCKACKLFIVQTKTATSFHAGYTVTIQGKLDCNTVGVCYLVNDKVCRRSSVGSTINNFKTRWQNHKSHIRKGIKSCEISCHFNSEFHDLTKEPLKVFDAELSSLLEVVIFEKLDFSKCNSQDDKVRVAKERETFFQQQFMTLECYGGMNKRIATNEIKH